MTPELSNQLFGRSLGLELDDRSLETESRGDDEDEITAMYCGQDAAGNSIYLALPWSSFQHWNLWHAQGFDPRFNPFPNARRVTRAGAPFSGSEENRAGELLRSTSAAAAEQGSAYFRARRMEMISRRYQQREAKRWRASRPKARVRTE